MVNEIIQKEHTFLDIEFAIKNHNKRQIPDHEDERVLKFAKLIRDIDKLDITIPGSTNNESRLVTKYFVYAPNACLETCVGPWLAYVKRLISGNDTVSGPFAYQMYIHRSVPNKVICQTLSSATAEQKKLCNQLNNNGTL